MAGSVFQHRNLKGEKDAKKIILIHKGSAVGAQAGPEGPARIPRRRVRRAPRSAGPGPGPSAGRSGCCSTAPGAQGPGPAGRPGPAGSAAGTAAAAAPGSLRPASGAFQAGGHRCPARDGASRSLQRKMGRAELRSSRKKGKNRLQTAPGAAIGLSPGHAAPTPLGMAPRVLAAVPDAPVTSRGRGRRLQSRRPAATAARAET